MALTAFDARLKRTFYVIGFDFGEESYNKLLQFQGGRCAICGKLPKTIRHALDHRHTDGLIRGILCFLCNRGFGLFHDNNCHRLRMAANYLENPPATECFGKELFTAKGKLGTKVRAKLLRQMKGTIVGLQQNKSKKKK